MGNIVKLLYDDGEELALEVTPMEEIWPTDDSSAKFQKQRDHRMQFRRFQRKILSVLDSQIVEDYAKDQFDLIDEYDSVCNDVHLDTCSDKLLFEEASARGLIANYKPNIVNENFAFRFAQIVDRGNPIEIDNWLSEMEAKLRLVV